MKTKVYLVFVVACTVVQLGFSQNWESRYVLGNDVPLYENKQSKKPVHFVSWGESFPILNQEKNWFEVLYRDSQSYFIAADFFVKRGKFVRKVKKQENKNAQTYYVLRRHYQDKNRMGKEKKYAKEVLLKAPDPLIYLNLKQCENLFHRAAGSLVIQENRRVKYFKKLEPQIKDREALLFLLLHEIMEPKFVQKDSLHFTNTVQKILVENAETIVNHNGFTCQDSTTRSFDDYVLQNFAIAYCFGKTKASRILKREVKQIVKENNHPKMEELLTRILDFFDKIDEEGGIEGTFPNGKKGIMLKKAY